MDSFNLCKGYNQMNHRESIIFIILLTLTFGFLIHYSVEATGPAEPESLSSRKTETGVIQHVCKMTRYTESTQPNMDPRSLVLSLHCALFELSRIRNLPESLILRVNETQTRVALRDCGALFGEALNLVNQTLEAAVRHVRVSDVNAWISGSMSDVVTCLDGLDEMGCDGEVSEEIKREVTGSMTWMSISLAIVANGGAAH